MDDNKIIELYFKRNENAISATAEKYGGYCYSVAYNILQNKQDSDESVNDTYLGAWNSIPPHKPNNLSAYLAKLTRNISLNIWRKKNTDKRGNGEVPVALEELKECLPSQNLVDDEVQANELSIIIDAFLRKLPQEERVIFVRRYWYLEPVADIAKNMNLGLSKVKMTLHRTRIKLHKELQKGGYDI